MKYFTLLCGICTNTIIIIIIIIIIIKHTRIFCKERKLQIENSKECNAESLRD
jgi:hypothetical protein